MIAARVRRISRRDALVACAAALAAGCSRRDRGGAPASAASSAPDGPLGSRDAVDGDATRIVEWTFASHPGERAAVILPNGPPARKYPVVIALHGRGEALKGPAAGAMGWPRDYLLRRAYQRLMRPPLVAADFEGLAPPAHLDESNRALASRPFGGLVIACPYLPDVDLSDPREINAYARFVIDVLLPRVRAETPALPGAESTGIDGVSLGGAMALHVGLGAPDVFGAVGALQPAISEDDAQTWAERARAARSRRPGLPIRLTTSKDDGFRGAIARASQALRAAGVPHDFHDLLGPHDYVWNRGPGAIELLTWHDRVLSRGAPDERDMFPGIER